MDSKTALVLLFVGGLGFLAFLFWLTHYDYGVSQRPEVQMQVRRGPEYWSAWDHVSNIVGIGDAPEAAVQDYEQSLAEQLAWFKANEHQLGRGLAADYEAMKAAGMVEPEGL
jgi:hypothetical protein